MSHQTDSDQIDDLIAAFYAAFDNRNGIIPNGRDLYQILDPRAIIARANGSTFEFMSPHDFVSPRIELLTDGRLIDFHEWEKLSATEIRNHLASRISEYSKAGLLNNEPYSGTGSKIFQLIRENGNWKILSITWQDHNV